MGRISSGHVYGRYVHGIPDILVGLLAGLLLAGAGCGHEREPAVHDRARAPVGAAAMSDEISANQPVQRPVPGLWPAAAFDGTQYLVVWEDFRAGRPILYGARVAADGTALDPSGFPILDVALINSDYQPVTAFDGSNFLVVTAVPGQILGVRVSRDGEVLDPGGIEIASPEIPTSWPSIAFDGEQYLVAWSQGAYEASPAAGIYWARVRPDGTVLDPGGVRGFSLSREPISVGVSFDGTQHLLSWTDRDAGEQTSLYAARIGTSGTLLDPAPILAGSLDALDSPTLVAGFDGTNHVIAVAFVFYQPNRFAQLRIRAIRVTPQGEVLDPDPIVIHDEPVEADGLNRLDMTAGNGRSIVLWSMDYGSDDGGPLAPPISAAEIAADGTVSTHPANAFTRGVVATLVAHPAGALLLWCEGDGPFDRNAPLVGTRLDAAGMPVAGSVVVPASTGSRQRPSAVASDGHGFFVLWTDMRDPAARGQALYGARIAADGTLLDPDAIEIDPRGTDEAAYVASVVFDGVSFLVSWVNEADDAIYTGWLQAVRVSPAGELLDTEPLMTPLRRGFRTTLAVASNGTHTLLVGEAFVRGGDDPLSVVLVDQNGTAGDVIQLFSPEESRGVSNVVVTSDGARFLVIWWEYPQVLGMWLGADGRPAGERFRIGESTFLPMASVASGGGISLVAWATRGGLFVARVSPAGQVLDPGGKLIVPLESLQDVVPSLTYDGRSFVIAWAARTVADDPLSVNLHGAEVSASGELLRQFAISEQPDSESPPFLAAGEDGQVLAMYSRFVPGAPYESLRVRARLLTSEIAPMPVPDAGPPVPAPDAGPPVLAPDAGGAPIDPPPGGGDGGCGCRVGAGQQAPVAPLLLLGVGALWLVRRRRTANRE